VGSIEIGKVADLVAFEPAFFGTKPSLVLKGGIITWGDMGKLCLRKFKGFSVIYASVTHGTFLSKVMPMDPFQPHNLLSVDQCMERVPPH
jgi:hypothetical protein